MSRDEQVFARPISANYGGASAITVTRYDKGVPVETVTIQAPSVEGFRLAVGKRGPKPGEKVADKSARGKASQDYESNSW